MLIENMMYFALGLMAASLVGVIVMPAVWKRAVRLTKRRIEAATPITLAEFRADKDQLRAEYALTIRRLEVTVETLRQRLADHLRAAEHDQSETIALASEREQHRAIVADFETRQASLQARLHELERANTDLAQQVRWHMRTSQVHQGEIVDADGGLLPLDSESDSEIGQLAAAEARLASAETRLSAILAQTRRDNETEETASSLADELNRAEALARLRADLAHIETTLTAAPDSSPPDTPLDTPALRQKLTDISLCVSRLVLATGSDEPAEDENNTSLFERVQRFADDGETEDSLPRTPDQPPDRAGAVSDRLAALHEIQGR